MIYLFFLFIGWSTTLEEIRLEFRHGNHRRVIELANASISVSENAELYFWRGASYRRLTQYPEALDSFDRAKDLGLSNPELSLERALTLDAMGNQEEADKQFQEAEGLGQEDEGLLQRIRETWHARHSKEEKRFQLWFLPTIGVDTNIVGVDEETPLSEGDVERESFYYGLGAQARFNLWENQGARVFSDLQATFREYEEESDYSYTNTRISLTGLVPLVDRITGQLQLTYDEAFIDFEGHFRTQRGIRPSIVMKATERMTITLFGGWSNADYYNSPPSVQDRDGDTYDGGISLGFDLGKGWKASTSLGYVLLSGEGSDYDHREWNLGGSLSPPTVFGFDFTGQIGYLSAEYENGNSLLDGRTARDEWRLVFALSVRLAFIGKKLGYTPGFTMSYQRSDSNVAAFDFNESDFAITAPILVWSF